MTGRILVVDDMETNIRVLTAKLEAEYYEVLSANNGAEAILLARETQPDLILLDVMMPIMDGYQTCRQLKRDPVTMHIPVVMVTALDGQTERVKGLEAGADDFLSKPIDDLSLFARVRSLLRLNSVISELRVHEADNMGNGVLARLQQKARDEGGKVLVVDEDERYARRIIRKLGGPHQCTVSLDPRTAPDEAAHGIDLVILNLAATAFDGLRIVARIRANDATRAVPILCAVDPNDRGRAVRALDLGANDILERPAEEHELRARVNTLMQRRLYATQLRQSLDASVELAFNDELTGLSNRRHMDGALTELAGQVTRTLEPAVVFITDVDHFKKVNDTWGHQAGDLVLQQVAQLLRDSFRAVDVLCRYGGEEFVVLMPDTGLVSAKAAAERFRQAIESHAFEIGKDRAPIHVTASGGLSEILSEEKGPEALQRADAALYHAKQNGRNRVVAARKAQKPAARAAGI